MLFENPSLGPMQSYIVHVHLYELYPTKNRIRVLTNSLEVLALSENTTPPLDEG